MISEALVSSLAFPLLEPAYLVGGRTLFGDGEGWVRLHDRFIEERHPGLSLDEIRELRQWAWGAIESSAPVARDAVRRLAECLTEPHRGKIVLRNNAFGIDKSSLSGRTDAFPGDIQRAWAFASRYVEPEMVCVWHWSEVESDPRKREDCWPEVGVQSVELTRLLEEGIGDYHIHWGAVRKFDSFLPIISTLGQVMGSLEGWGDDDNWIDVDWFGTGRVYPDLLIIVHGVICSWLRQYILNVESERKGKKIKWAKPLVDAGCAERCWRKLVGIIAQQPVKRDCKEIIRGLGPILGIDGIMRNKRSEYADYVFLYEGFRAYGQVSTDDGASKGNAFVFLFNKMLWLRGGLYRLLTQQAGTQGLKSFKRWHSHIRNLSIDSVTRDESSLYDKINVLTQGNPQGIETLEFRIVIPRVSRRKKDKRGEDWYKGYLRYYIEWKHLEGEGDVTDQEAIRVCFSGSLIKEEREDVFGGIKVRHSEILNEYRERVDDFVGFLKQKDNGSMLYLIRGLDVCNLEKALPNWVPLLAYQHFNKRLENEVYPTKNLPSHKHTFHAGEDFHMPSDGLRAVYECIEMGGMRKGDRVGHGIVLGLNIGEWADDREVCLVPAGVLLDDLVWEWACVRESRIEGNIAEIEHEIEIVERQIATGYRRKKTLKLGETVRPSGLWEAYQLRFDYGKLGNGLGRERIKLIRGDEWFDWRVCNKLKAVNGDVYGVFWEYLCDPARWRAEQIPICVRIDESRVLRFQRLQEYVTKLAKDKVAIEMCPTSNVVVSGLEEYSRHPIFQLCPVGNDPGVSVSISSDDPLTFNTNVRKEYQNLFLAAQKKEDVTDNQIKKWLKEINEMGRDYSFFEWDAKGEERLEKVYSRLFGPRRRGKGS